MVTAINLVVSIQYIPGPPSTHIHGDWGCWQYRKYPYIAVYGHSWVLKQGILIFMLYTAMLWPPKSLLHCIVIQTKSLLFQHEYSDSFWLQPSPVKWCHVTPPWEDMFNSHTRSYRSWVKKWTTWWHKRNTWHWEDIMSKLWKSGESRSPTTPALNEITGLENLTLEWEELFPFIYTLKGKSLIAGSEINLLRRVKCWWWSTGRRWWGRRCRRL